MTGLTGVSLPELESLLREVESGELGCPLDRTALQASGFAHLVGPLSIFDGVTAAGVVAALRIAIAERRRPRPEVELVWTGPEARGSATRETGVVLRRLLAGARREVLLAGYTFTHGEDLLRPLYEVMRDHGVRAIVVLDLPNPGARVAVEDHVVRHVGNFFQRNWRFGPPLPEVYYDPRTVKPKPEYSNMHAKCVVVDGELALVGSANFTKAAQKQNLEVGVLVRDRELAERLGSQWIGMIEDGLLRRYESPPLIPPRGHEAPA